MKPFEIFRTGTHTTAKGQTLTFAETDVADIAASYDPALHEAPIVVGHPKQDGPAYGWVKSLSVKDGRIVAEPDRLDAAFSEMVRGGRFSKVSAGLYHPNEKSNPTPGKYHLRHVGFLGAEPPAVKGLKPIEFAEASTTIELEFSESRQSWAFDTVARLFRGLRDHIISTTNIETADRVVSDWDVEQLTQVASDMRAKTEAKDGLPHFSETKPEELNMKTAEQRQAELDAREAALKQREEDAATRDTTFSEKQRATRAAEDEAFVAVVVGAGRLPIGLKETATALFSELDDGEILTFSEGETTITTSPRAAFRSFLEKLPTPVNTRELATGDGPDFSDPQHVADAITTEIKSAKDNGEDISHATALSRLKQRR